MTPPKRLLDELDLTDDEFRALAAGLNMQVPPEAKTAVWKALQSKLPPAAAAATATATATKAAATVTAAKMGLAGVVFGTAVSLAVVGGQSLLTAHSPATTPRTRLLTTRAPVKHDVGGSRAESAPATSGSAEPSTKSIARDRTRETAPPESVKQAPQPAVRSPSIASFPLTADSELNASSVLERRRVADARARLLAGDARGTLVAVDALRRDFPRGLLDEERDELNIEALLALGELDTARGLAVQFLARYPASAHAGAAKRALK